MQGIVCATMPGVLDAIESKEGWPSMTRIGLASECPEFFILDGLLASYAVCYLRVIGHQI